MGLKTHMPRELRIYCHPRKPSLLPPAPYPYERRESASLVALHTREAKSEEWVRSSVSSEK